MRKARKEIRKLDDMIGVIDIAVGREASWGIVSNTSDLVRLI